MIPYAISEDLAQFQTINSSLMLREDGSANISLFDSNGSLWLVLQDHRLVFSFII